MIHTCAYMFQLQITVTSYLTGEQLPFKKLFLFKITTATRCMIYYKAQTERLLYIGFVLQLCHPYQVEGDGYSSSTAITIQHISPVIFATSAAVNNLIQQYVLCNEIRRREYENVFNLISFPLFVWEMHWSSEIYHKKVCFSQIIQCLKVSGHIHETTAAASLLTNLTGVQDMQKRSNKVSDTTEDSEVMSSVGISGF